MNNRSADDEDGKADDGPNHIRPAVHERTSAYASPHGSTHPKPPKCPRSSLRQNHPIAGW